jgi:hypothetical protein
MKVISCPIPGKSLIIQFEPAAAAVLERRVPAHGLLLGLTSGSDPKWLRVHHLQPVFGVGEVPGPAVAETTSLITLGYYTIRADGDTLTEDEREFLATSLPRSSALAVVITGKMQAQFYLRDSNGAFGPFPDHRQPLAIQDARPLALPMLEPEPEVPQKAARTRGPWPGIGIGAALVLGLALFALMPRTAEQKAAPVTIPATHHQVSLPPPDFLLPVQSVKLIPAPPEVAIWYAEPASAPSDPPAVAEAHRTMLIHPIMAQR